VIHHISITNLFKKHLWILFILFTSLSYGKPFFLGGIFIHEPDTSKWITSIKQTGLDTVEVTIWARQQKWDSEDILFEPIDEETLGYIRAAKAAGLKVVFVSRALLDHGVAENKFLWHGSIYPKTDKQLEQWFKNYSNIVTKWAKICEQEDVDFFLIGSEMNALVNTKPLVKHPILTEYFSAPMYQEPRRKAFLKFSDQIPDQMLSHSGYKHSGEKSKYIDAKLKAEELWARQVSYDFSEDSITKINERRSKLEGHWRTLIKDVRKHYHGLVSYAANYDSYHEVAFWDALDLMGINAYFPLRAKTDVSIKKEERVGHFQKKWTTALQELKTFRKENKLEEQAVIFTELGYNDRAMSSLEPWRGYGFSIIGEIEKEEDQRLILWRKQKPNLQERADALQALYNSLQEVDLPFAGLLYWKLTTNPEHKKFEAFLLPLSGADPDPSLEKLSLFHSFKN